MAQSAGRPKGATDARAQLVQAARRLFVSKAYDQVSIRMLAQHAGVNSALIRYYFGDKAGLFEAMLRETTQPILEQFQLMAGHKSIDSVTGLLQIYYRIMGDNPDLPRLVARVMMEHETGPQRQIIEKIVAPLLQRLEKVLFAQPDRLRFAAPPDMARLSFLSLMVFPFLAPPAMLALQGIRLTPDYLDALATHNVRVLTHGLLAAEQSAMKTDSEGDQS
jgi:AcrR family transcriptional regulator